MPNMFISHNKAIYAIFEHFDLAPPALMPSRPVTLTLPTRKQLR